jgi:methylated-DNA-[protein]-cysteine S-methyltransferase
LSGRATRATTPPAQLSGAGVNSSTDRALRDKAGGSPMRALASATMAQAHSYTLFATAIGTCAVAWSDFGLTGVWLPAADGGDLRRQVLRRAPDAHAASPVGTVADVIEAIARLLAGERVGFDDVVLDLADVEPFDRAVYVAARAIPAGHVVSYGELSARIGAGATARAVGRSLGRNRWPLVVPCHRVVASGERRRLGVE